MDEINEKPPRKTFFTWKGALVTLSLVPMKSEVKVPMHELDTWLTDKRIPQNQIVTFLNTIIPMKIPFLAHQP